METVKSTTLRNARARAAAWVLLLLLTSAPASAAIGDRGLMTVEFLYAIEYAGGRSDMLKAPMDLFFDRKHGELYVTDPGRHAVLIYDRNGMFVQELRVESPEGAASQVAVDARGRIYVTHLNSPRLTVLDYRGAFLDSFLLPGTEEKGRVRPMSLAAGPDGGVYALLAAGGVVRVDPDGEAHRVISLKGEGQPNAITAVAVDGDGRLLFGDMRPYSWVRLDPATGKFERHGTPGVLYGQLARPSGLASDEAGHVFVLSSVTSKVSCFDRQGKFYEEFGALGDGYGTFYMPSKVVSDGKDRLYVLESMLRRIQVFRIGFPSRGALVGSPSVIKPDRG
ncbi:MAG: hypothetical protein HY900_16060 [Deltaproteobacteria bacterium]|nr:hypothetical protein [Deltaproteobacteria bacterium]